MVFLKKKKNSFYVFIIDGKKNANGISLRGIFFLFSTISFLSKNIFFFLTFSSSLLAQSIEVDATESLINIVQSFQHDNNNNMTSECDTCIIEGNWGWTLCGYFPPKLTKVTVDISIRRKIRDENILSQLEKRTSNFLETRLACSRLVSYRTHAASTIYLIK